MTDDERVAELLSALQRLFDADDPSDGIDRHDGYGRDYRVVGLRVVPSDDGFDDLEVSVLYGGQAVTARLLFDRAWREASGLVDASSCAAYIVGTWQGARSGEARPPAPHRQAASDTTGLWRTLQQSLVRDYVNVNQVSHGRVEVVDEDGEIVTIHLTPQQWRDFVDQCEAFAERDSGEDAWGAGDGLAIALGELDELISSRWDDEEHIMFFRGRPFQSVRPELPPLRSRLLPE
ncbi:hypothetical protein [Aeromicrobium endophyticum]|uniref:Uncharacterized protein n=1 Tax=Aeromicrobium endophyticum TaxID=2292704 RepID=A0A371P154_9ACTN|nr:hypothetical protein [Aeromicrobium endophyticum]REK69673.1 hypothetical protein DX116_10735 [Aeromicrobium endophyticum]